jgi:hypothetical protein
MKILPACLTLLGGVWVGPGVCRPPPQTAPSTWDALARAVSLCARTSQILPLGNHSLDSLAHFRGASGPCFPCPVQDSATSHRTTKRCTVSAHGMGVQRIREHVQRRPEGGFFRGRFRGPDRPQACPDMPPVQHEQPARAPQRAGPCTVPSTPLIRLGPANLLSTAIGH